MLRAVPMLALLALLAACAGQGGGRGGYGAASPSTNAAAAPSAPAPVIDAARRAELRAAGVAPVPAAEAASMLAALEERLAEDLRGTGATVSRVAGAVVAFLPESGAFAPAGEKARKEFRPALERVGATLAAFPASFIDVTAHTDSTGDAEKNRALTQKRADHIAGVLAWKGVARARIRAVGRGEADPIASDADAWGRARNRRAEIRVTPFTQG